MSTSGSLGKFTYNKQTYNIVNDADISRQAPFNVEVNATSGDPNVKIEKQVETASGFVAQMDGAQREIFRRDANPVNGAKPASYTNAKGDNYTADVVINITDDTTMDSKITFDASPVKAAGWTPTIV